MNAKLASTAAGLMLAASPAAAEEWMAVPFGPPNLSYALDTDTLGAGDAVSAWFRITRLDLAGRVYLIRKERYEFRCSQGESRFAEWGDFYPDGRLAAIGRAPRSLEFKPVELGGREGLEVALWRAACGRG